MERAAPNKLKVLLALTFGTIVEWYDYSLYGYMAAILSNHFFPDVDKTTAFINHFIVFAMGFLATPIGSYIFSCVGDGYGRRHAIRWSIIGIALPTVMIGCLPSYEQAGAIVLIVLCACRLCQGMFTAAEADGVDIFLYETMPKSRLCAFMGFNWLSSGLGMGLAAFFAGIVMQSTMPAWAWRLPFLLGGVLGMITLLLRKNLIESYDFAHYTANNVPPRMRSFSSFISIIKSYKKSIFLSFLLQSAVTGTCYFYFVFWGNYIHNILELDSSLGSNKSNFETAILVLSFSIIAPICGYTADRIGRMKAARLGGFICLGMIALNGSALYYHNKVPFILMLPTAISIAFFAIPAYWAIIQMFDITERYRCRAFGHALSTIIISSTTPLISMYLWKHFQKPVAPIFYPCLLLLIGFITSLFIKVKEEPITI